jgi:FGGY-family pentulose kinase
MQPVVCAVDVGTGSARAGIVDASGNFLGRAEFPIEMRYPRYGHAEQDSEQVWAAVCAAVRAVREQADVDPEAVCGIAFDATCSLVLRARDGSQLPVSPLSDARWDTIAWLDHRALAEADECTATGHRAVARAGGAMSPEMQVPKLMWLKRHRPDAWRRSGAIYDLADYLSFRASGSNARSQNTLACKWAYEPQSPQPWPGDLFDAVDLSDIIDRAGLPDRATPLGSDAGPLLPGAAHELGLTPACRVGVGLVDAYAGMLGVLGSLPANKLKTECALVAGTSSCVMFASPRAELIGSAWGPYADAAMPGSWISEAGQSATGALLDHVVRLHGLEPDTATHRRIVARISELRDAAEALAPDLHVLPDFHGNRAPFAEPRALGVISGLPLDSSFEGMCRLYWRSCVAIALGVRQIVDFLREKGRSIDTLHVAGGHVKNPLLMELYTEATGCRIVEPDVPDAMLLGTAMVAAAASRLHPDLARAALAMGRAGRLRPQPAANRYERDYRIFLEMHRQRRALEAL